MAVIPSVGDAARQSARFRAIGNTPLFRVRLPVTGIEHDIVLQLEGHNPTGSVKDRVAWSLVSNAMISEPVPDEFVCTHESVEFSLSSLYCCTIYSKPITIVSEMPLLTIIESAASQYDPRRETRYQTASQAVPRGTLLRDSSHPIVADIHANWLAPELLGSVGHEVDTIFVGDATEGLALGLLQYIHTKSLSIDLAMVESNKSSAFIEQPDNGMLPILLGANRRFEHLARGQVNYLDRIHDGQAIAATRIMNREFSLSIGPASGGILVGALRYLAQQESAKRVVCICPDADKSLPSLETLPRWEELDQQATASERRLAQILKNAKPI
jgi:cysteine synthase